MPFALWFIYPAIPLHYPPNFSPDRNVISFLPFGYFSSWRPADKGTPPPLFPSRLLASRASPTTPCYLPRRAPSCLPPPCRGMLVACLHEVHRLRNFPMYLELAADLQLQLISDHAINLDRSSLATLPACTRLLSICILLRFSMYFCCICVWISTW